MSGNIYGLFVGIDAYPEGIGPLRFCSADAIALHDFFAQHTSSSNLKLLTYPSGNVGMSSKTSIIMALKEFSLRYSFTQEDIFIFFFAGHGIYVNKEYFLLTSDLVDPAKDCPFVPHLDVLRECSLPIDTLKEFADQITAGSQVVIIDACRNHHNSRSAFDRGMDAATGKIFSALKERKITPVDNDLPILRAVVSSCWLGQRSWEYERGGHGWFTYHLLECLHGVNETSIDLGILLKAVKERMQKYSFEFPLAANQRPHLMLDGESISLPLGPGNVPPPPILKLLDVAALNKHKYFQCYNSGAPKPYWHVKSANEPGHELFYRAKDNQLAVRVPHVGLEFALIDQYAITNAQLCVCLNDLIAKRKAGNQEEIFERNQPVWCCVDEAGKLVVDAPGYWRAYSKAKDVGPWYCAGTPWGITYESKWIPLPGCEVLPATLVTWHGADIYSRWAHDRLEARTGSFLPAEVVWKSAAGTTSRGLATTELNFAGYWAGRDLLTVEDVERHQCVAPSTFVSAKPLSPDKLSGNASSSGCIQLIGNVWEWCQDKSGPQKRVLKGGSCISSREECDVNYSFASHPGRLDPYVGFRCAFYGKEA